MLELGFLGRVEGVERVGVVVVDDGAFEFECWGEFAGFLGEVARQEREFLDPARSGVPSVGGVDACWISARTRGSSCPPAGNQMTVSGQPFAVAADRRLLFVCASIELE